MSWLRARMCSGSSCRYSIACMAASVPSLPRQRRPGHRPCLPRMKRRAISRSMTQLRVVIDIEDVILRRCLDSQVVEQSEQLGTMIGAVINHMEQHLPHDEVFVFVWF